MYDFTPIYAIFTFCQNVYSALRESRICVQG